MSESGTGESGRLTPGPLRGLACDGLDLRPWEPAQAAALVALAADPLIATWNPVAAADEEQAAAWIASRREWNDHATWALLGPDGGIWGSVSLFHLDAANASGEIGYWVAPQARGRGVAARAVRSVSAFAFTELALERLELFHAIENTASCRVAEKAGFIIEGTLRKSYRYADGILHDEHVHGRLSTDV